MRHAGIVAFASALTVAAGLAWAQQGPQQSQPGPPGQQPAEASGPDGKGTPRDHSGTKNRGSTGWTGGSNETTETKPGVGSRALSDPEKQRRAADQPEMATGVDLMGPPVRFPAAETPE